MFRGYLFPAVFCVVLVCLIAPSVLPSAAEKSSQNPSQQPSSSEQLKKLQEKVAQLDARVAALEKRPALLALPPASPSAPLQLPKGWQQREFNGLRYYDVPLGGNKISTHRGCHGEIETAVLKFVELVCEDGATILGKVPQLTSDEVLDQFPAR